MHGWVGAWIDTWVSGWSRHHTSSYMVLSSITLESCLSLFPDAILPHLSMLLTIHPSIHPFLLSSFCPWVHSCIHHLLFHTPIILPIQTCHFLHALFPPYPRHTSMPTSSCAHLSDLTQVPMHFPASQEHSRGSHDVRGSVSILSTPRPKGPQLV